MASKSEIKRVDVQRQAHRDRLNDAVADAVGKVVAAVEQQQAQSLREAVASGWRARDAVIIAAHELKAAYDKRASCREHP